MPRPAPRARRPTVILIGAGRLGAALGGWLADAGYPPLAVVSRTLPPAARLRRRAGAAHAWRLDDFVRRLAALDAAPVWLLLAVPDDAIQPLAARLAAARPDWRGFTALHTSGARDAATLLLLRRRGAAVGSLHPLMTFPARARRARAAPGTSPAGPAGLVFGIEGDPAARRRAAQLVAAFQGLPLPLSARAKAAYHLAATLVGPGAVIQFAAAESLLLRAGLAPRHRARARRGLLALLAATAANLHRGPAAAFTGPLARGDCDTIALHLRLLAAPPASPIGPLYRAAARAALRLLPVPPSPALRRLLAPPRKS